MRYLLIVITIVCVPGCILQGLAEQGFLREITEPAQSTSYLQYGRSFASRGVGMVGNSIVYGVHGLGVGTQFTLRRLSKAFSAINTQSLSAALGVLSVSKKIARSVDLHSVLRNLIEGQVSSASVINYETTTVFLEKLFDMVPQLKKIIVTYKTVSYAIHKIKKLRQEGKPINAVKIMKGAVDTFFKDVDPAFKEKVVGLSPQIYAAACGDTVAARHVATALADRTTLIEALKGIGYKTQAQILQKVIAQVCEYANAIKLRASTKKMEDVSVDQK